ncbi:hypothetical protein PVK06_024270 [Gossypium arboreum]|uniref:CASP-like protein n=1 Tax=Gossypium arboreum TaxID=29729 RepID=A0ABR0PDM6_GOSAR|nr:hypothetical protein PVK06_024270 [Gossypium arboreum]
MTLGDSQPYNIADASVPYDSRSSSKDPMELPQGPVTRAKAKAFKDSIFALVALSGTIFRLESFQVITVTIQGCYKLNKVAFQVIFSYKAMGLL